MGNIHIDLKLDKAVSLKVEILENLSSISKEDWNKLGASPYPFLKHEFLSALEKNNCLGSKWGWIPRHIVIFDSNKKLIAATPLYLKYNSYGEFVFDWSWAEAYERNGLIYYPKLVSASPYTPATAPKLLINKNCTNCKQLLIDAAKKIALENNCSSIHWLFTTDDQMSDFSEKGFMRRTGCQFHWNNNNYKNFDDFLSTFSSSKRKQINRERRRVKEAGIKFQILNGEMAVDEDWVNFHNLYESTFEKKGGMPTLTLDFFQSIASKMPKEVLLVKALYGKKVVAAAFNLVGDETLYGRHWGCSEEFHSLHFEACYYQGLQFCIDNGLKKFEPGAQGEHKISRGFLPTPTWSYHWMQNDFFQRNIKQYLKDEHEGMIDYMKELNEHSPYKIL